MESSVQFRVSINRRWPAQKLGLPPTETRWARYNASFKAEEHTPDSLLSEVVKGYAFTAVLGGCLGPCCGTWCANAEHREITDHCGRPIGYRRHQHFQSAQFIALDFDTGDERSTFGHLLGRPLIVGHGSFLYTTLSHTSDHPKSRVVFITDAPIIDPDHYRRSKRAVMAQLPWGDAPVHNPARLFYGSQPEEGQAHYLGNVLPLEVLGQLIEAHRSELESEQPRRELPQVPGGTVMGNTPAERYVNTAIQQEMSWVASRVEGTGERHKGLLISAMKLSSLRLSDWLPAELRDGINVPALLLPAAQANGYIAKYGESVARQTIADGIAYARPRPKPSTPDYTKPWLRWSGGQWVKAVWA